MELYKQIMNEKQCQFFLLKYAALTDNICEVCGKPIPADRAFCSRECYEQRELYRIEKECPTCHKLFKVSLSLKNKIYCSRECQENYLLSFSDNKKKCFRCGELKQFDKFHRSKMHKSGYSNICKTCKNEETKINKAKKRESYNAFRREKYLENQAFELKRRKQWRDANKKLLHDIWAEKYYNDISFRLISSLKSQIYSALVKKQDMDKYFDLFGYSIFELKEHLENQFENGMTWENYGTWHIDHIRPKSWFNLKNKNGSPNYLEIKKCWALDNLQPLWAHENMSKGNRYEGKYKKC